MRIKEVRKQKKMTQKDLANAIGVDFTVVSKYEKGTVTPPTSRLEAISKVLNVPIDYLIGEDIIVETKPASPVNESLSSDLVLDQNSLLFQRLLAYAKGCCELCGNAAPFEKDGVPYLEMHQLQAMSDGGLPIPENTVLLCPNCHTRIHQLKNEDDLNSLKEAAKKHTA